MGSMQVWQWLVLAAIALISGLSALYRGAVWDRVMKRWLQDQGFKTSDADEGTQPAAGRR
jgi:hypothetical protein